MGSVGCFWFGMFLVCFGFAFVLALFRLSLLWVILPTAAATTTSLYPNGSISVFNANRFGGPDGKANSISGYATIPKPKVTAKLQVHFHGSPAGAPCVCG
jgi:hypothetical protein